MAAAVFVIVYFTANKEKTSTLAGYREDVSLREHKLICAADFEAENEKHPKCISACKRFVTDNLFSENDISHLQDLARKIFFKNEEFSEIYYLSSNSLDDVTKNMYDTIKVNLS